MISDWLAAKLSGELAVDPSNAGTTGMLDLFSRDWRPALLDMAGLRADILSPVKETGTLLGAVTERRRSERPARRHAGGDGRRRRPARLPGSGGGTRRANAVLGGTFWQQVVNLPEVRTDPQMNIRVNPHVIPGMAQAVDQLLYRPDHALVPRRLLR
jgi:autoinducer 2 (AI-2) kinase